MAKGSINKVILIGNLGMDPELKNLPDGTSLVNLSMATTESWPDKNNPQDRIEKTEWHRIVFFARPAEIIHEYARKGSKMYIEGALTHRKYQDKDGNIRYFTEVKGREFCFLGGRGDALGGGGGGGGVGATTAAGAPGDDFGDIEDVPF